MHALKQFILRESTLDPRIYNPETFVAKDGRTLSIYSFRGSRDEEKFPEDEYPHSTVVTVVVKDQGVAVGVADCYFHERDRRIGNVEDIAVDGQYQRTGIATEIYDYLERIGYRIECSGNLSDDGRAFWQDRKYRVLLRGRN